jgi:hypothetical protein
VDRVHGLWTSGAFGPPWTKGAGRQRRGRGTGWWPHLAPVGDEEVARRRGVAAVVGARRARPSELGEEGMMRGMHCGGGGRGVAPFYRVGDAVRCGERPATEVRYQGTGYSKGRRRGIVHSRGK